MKILVVGGGGREHALVWKIAQSPLVKKIYCAPGNPGIARQAECVPLRADDLVGIVQFVREKGVDLTVVGPEDPLSMGIADELTPKGFKVFGPTRAAAELESSKVFSKRIMQKHGIPTAAFHVFQDAHDAHDYVAKVAAPLVVKADGLAKGKGVIVCGSADEAHEAIRDIMERRVFGKAGDQVVIEECLRGQEASILAISDGRTIVLLEPAQDHKRIGDGDTGPNTGGMGAYTTRTIVDDQMRDWLLAHIARPVVAGMKAEGAEYKGVLYCGLMMTARGPMVLEFNCRFGDPETQPILMRLESDLVEAMEASIDGRTSDGDFKWSNDAAVCVVMASGGYPGAYEAGKKITGLEDAAKLDGVKVFHAGTSKRDEVFYTSGGRVLGVTARAAELEAAVQRAYDACAKIGFEGAHYRKDIASRALKKN